MRGSPLLRALLAFLAILALGWPLHRLTSASDAPREQPKPAATEAKEIELALTFTLVPKSVKVLHLGREVWSESAPAAELKHTLKLAYPAEGVDLQFQIEWPADAPLAAMRATLTDPAGDVHEKSVWGQGTTDEAVTFP
ncbi:MAG: hypothetical protein K8R23_12545 [Chthoniobacter sp.]|nr:hypothetical protein [Chthoniobacter sp.]